MSHLVLTDAGVFDGVNSKPLEVDVVIADGLIQEVARGVAVPADGIIKGGEIMKIAL